jgi:hypothetical protein
VVSSSTVDLPGASDTSAPSPRALAASVAASGAAAATNMFGQIIMVVGGLGGTIASFMDQGIFGAIIFFIGWSFIGATLWQIVLVVMALIITGAAYGIVWLLYPASWPTWLRWVLVLPVAIAGFVLATLVNVVFRAIEFYFPWHEATAIGSLFFVSFAQTVVAVVAAAWIAPSAKTIVCTVLCTLTCVAEVAAIFQAITNGVPADTPEWAYILGSVLGMIGALSAAIVVSRSEVETA